MAETASTAPDRTPRNAGNQETRQWDVVEHLHLQLAFAFEDLRDQFDDNPGLVRPATTVELHTLVTRFGALERAVGVFMSALRVHLHLAREEDDHVAREGHASNSLSEWHDQCVLYERGLKVGTPPPDPWGTESAAPPSIVVATTGEA